MGHIKLLSRLQPAEFPYCCVFLEINSCVLVCLDQERSAEMEHTEQQDRKKQMVFNKHWTGRARKLSRGSVCVSIFNENLEQQHCFQACVLFHLCTRTTVVLQEVARIVSWLNHVQWKQLGWTERRKERCYLNKHLRQGGGGGES